MEETNEEIKKAGPDEMVQDILEKAGDLIENQQPVNLMVGIHEAGLVLIKLSRKADLLKFTPKQARDLAKIIKLNAEKAEREITKNQRIKRELKRQVKTKGGSPSPAAAPPQPESDG